MRIRIIAPLILSLAAGGCTQWHAQHAPAPEVVARQHGRGSVRVQRRDGSVLVLETPSVSGDSIIGVGGTPPRRTSVALADVERIDRRGFSPVKTGGLVVGYFVVISLLAMGAALGAWTGAGLD
ncbi:MAG TPA: hypothetical protein VF771_08150 [Longimicrobiaceae bacterium]